MFFGPVEVKFERAPDLATGMFRIRSQALAGVVQMPGPGAGPGGFGEPVGAGGGGYAPYGAEPGYPPPGMGGMAAPPRPAPGGFPPAGPPIGAPPAPSVWAEINGVP